MFGTTKLTKNVDPDKSGYGGHGNGFDTCSQFSLPTDERGKYVVIVGVDIGL